MDKKPAVENRETRVRSGEIATEQDTVIVAREELLAARETLLRSREEALQSRVEAEEARVERERVMDQMREANEKLIVASIRANELTETIAKHAAALEVQDRAKDEFLAMLAHELRNPLSPIVSTLDLMEMIAPDAVVRERTIIKGQVKQLVRIVDDLLDISRVTRGRVELEIEPVELADVVSRAVETVAPIVERKAQVLRVEVAPAGLLVDGDFVRLAQVIGNLLTNAAKYTPDHGTIEVIAECRQPNIALRIHDNGIGISEENISRVFDLFAQVDRAPDRSQGGLGLGLTIAQRLVQMHGGSITARSDGIGRGSEFEIVLPASLRAPSVQDAERSVRAPAKPLRVLIVDDNRLATEAIQLLLSRLGYAVRVAFDGPTALAIAAEFVPEIALLDIGLPGMDGYELAGRLRELISRDRLRLIAVTGYGQQADRRRSAEAGFDEHLVKPVAIETLHESLCRATLRLPTE